MEWPWNCHGRWQGKNINNSTKGKCSTPIPGLVCWKIPRTVAGAMNCKFQLENSLDLTNTLKEETAGYTSSFQGFSRPPQHIHLLLKGQSSGSAQIFWSTVHRIYMHNCKGEITPLRVNQEKRSRWSKGKFRAQWFHFSACQQLNNHQVVQ